MTAQVSRFNDYHGYSSAAFDGWRRFSQYVVARDGTRLAVDYYRPTREGELHNEPLPVIWSHTRYQRANITDGELYTSLEYHPPLVNVLQHGYIIATADVRGAGASFGTKYGWFPPEEAEDAYDITEWFAEQSWCNDRVGMVRRSYLGITQYFNASQAPPHLVCIFPEVAWIDEYDLVYPGGIFPDWAVYCWSRDVESADRSAALPENWRETVEANREKHAPPAAYVELPYTGVAPAGGDPGGPVVPVDEDTDASLLAEATAGHRASPTPHRLVENLPHRDSVDTELGVRFHEQRSLYPRLGAIERSGVASYHLGGWFDGFARDTMLWFRNYPNCQKLVMGPWFHGGLAGIDMPAEYLRWYDHFLKDIDNGVLEEEAIHYWTLNAAPGTEWRATNEWPLAGEQRTSFYFCPGPSTSINSVNDGLLSGEPAGNDGHDEYTVDYTTSSGVDNRWTWTMGGGVLAEGVKPPHFYPYPDMGENDGKGLTYTTNLLDAALEITGHPVVHLWVKSTAQDGDFFVYLEDIEPDGRSAYVSEGQLRASHRRLSDPPYDRMGLPYHRSYAEDMLDLVPGEVAELVFDLQPVSYLFRAGNRVRVSITCADKDTFATPVIVPTPVVNLLHGPSYPSRMVLPVIPG